MADEQTTLPLIRTKLHRPPVTKDHLHRERLLDRLEKNRQRPLTLVSAPAGYGKNTLLSCWLDLLHCDHIETNVSHASPLNPISGILVAKVSHCET
jgi:LuxR family maltose regulon positive regulatory protein